MIDIIKKALYFPIASYFRFFARFRFQRWRPRVIVITGSSGKTTLLHLIESQLGKKARYSHHANSSYGIPFDILGLSRKTLTISEWLSLFLKAPLYSFKPPPKDKLYVVEADCDRPGEGQFLAPFLKPEVTLWVSLGKTHSMNFDQLVETKQFSSIEAAIAHEFGYFIEHTTKRAIINGDSPYIANELARTHVQTTPITQHQLTDYFLSPNGTRFIINKQKYIFPVLLPRVSFYAIAMCQTLMDYLHEPMNPRFANFHLPPGRSSLFKGLKKTTIIDSTYNANLSSMTALLDLFSLFPAETKWAIIGDMLEQGKHEKEEHERLADLLAELDCARIILMGPRVSRYTYPRLKQQPSKNVILEHFTTPPEVLTYLKKNLRGGETLLFKGARFLEGVIENLLEDKNDRRKLARREKIWEIRRKQWGL